jgi:hypothetical protein
LKDAFSAASLWLMLLMLLLPRLCTFVLCHGLLAVAFLEIIFANSHHDQLLHTASYSMHALGSAQTESEECKTESNAGEPARECSSFTWPGVESHVLSSVICIA